MKPDWKDAPEWANYLARDSDGEWWWYETEPVADDAGWWGTTDKTQICNPPKQEWNKSLEKKPNSDGTVTYYMKILVLMAQRKCDYAGQYGEEALACMSEYEYDDNPAYLHEKLTEYRNTNDFEAIEIVSLEVSSTEIQKRLFPDTSPILVTVS